MRLNSIRIRTMIVLLVLCVLIILVFGGIELFHARQGITNDTKTYDLQDSRYLANYVHLYIDNITGEADVISTSNDTIHALQGRDIPHLKEIADNLKGNTPQTSLVSFLDNNGSLLYSTKGLDLNIVRSYGWYSLALNSNTTYITGIYYSYTIHDYAIALVDPVRDNNTIIGRTLVLIQPQALQASIQSQLINPAENVIIVDRNGLLISHDNRTQLGLLTNVSSYTAVRNVLHGEEGVIQDRYTWDGQSRISAFYLTPDLGWGVIVSTPINLIYQPLKSEAIMMSGMLLVFILILLGVGYFVFELPDSPDDTPVADHAEDLGRQL